MTPDTSSMQPAWSQTRTLIVAALVLVGCRVVSAWESVVASWAALVVLAILAASIIANMPRTRRVLLFVALPAATLANSVVFAFGAFVALLGAQGLLVNGRILNGPPWSWSFAIVPMAAATNLIALAHKHSAPCWSCCVWLANLASACYVVWHWRADDPLMMAFAIPVAATSLIGFTSLSLATILWDARVRTSIPSVLLIPRRRTRRVVAAAALVACLLWMALIPVYRKRQMARSLERFGLHASFGIVFPGRTLPIELPIECYDYVGEMTGVAAPKALQGNALEAGRLLNTLPWLDFIVVNHLPAHGARLLQPLAGHQRVRHIALEGAGVTDETLADAARISALNRAGFRNAHITDAGLANLADAQWLQALEIGQTPISGEGLAHLNSLPRLTGLDLSDTYLGDRQTDGLRQLKTLRRLSLNNTPLTDQGLTSLAQCKTLRSIDLGGTRVTADGVERLRRALPFCTVVWNRTGDEP